MKNFCITFSAVLCLFILYSCFPNTSRSEESQQSSTSSNGENSSVFENVTKRETDLKKPEKYEDVRGQLKNDVYLNECFGFTIDVKQKGLTSELSNQEGFKYNFENPTAMADDAVLSVYTTDFNYSLKFRQSNQQSHAQKTAEDILAQDLSQYNVSITNKMLGDKQTAYAQVNGDGIKTDYYAMLVNGYYIKWEVKFSTSNAEYTNQLEQIINSIHFDWISE